jgi:hypothetical protein
MIKTLCGPIAAVALLAAMPSHAHSATLTGLWRTSITLVNCTSGDPLAPAFTSLLSFASDGTESEATNNPFLQPGQRSTAYGVWKRKGGNTFHMDTYALILFSTSGPPPIEAGSQRIRQDITLSGTTWTSNATIEFFDTSGKKVSNGCATAKASALK